MPESLIANIASHGGMGLVCAILLWTLFQKDKDLTAERVARVEDAKAGTKTALEIQSKVMEAVNKVSELGDLLVNEIRKEGNK